MLTNKIYQTWIEISELMSKLWHWHRIEVEQTVHGQQLQVYKFFLMKKVMVLSKKRKLW